LEFQGFPPPPDKPQDWAPYEDLLVDTNLLPDPFGNAATGDAEIAFSDSASDTSSRFMQAVSQLSELNSNNKADGEDWEMDPTEIALVVNATMAMSNLSDVDGLQTTELPRRKDKGVNPWWPFRFKEVSWSLCAGCVYVQTDPVFFKLACDWCPCSWLHTINNVTQYV
jgi:hypothetical protein